MMRPLAAERLSLQPLPAGADTPPAVRLQLDGRAAAQVLPGAVLEAAFECVGLGDAHLLLFLSDDVPFEDFLHLHLLDAQLALLDSASLGAPYSTGTFVQQGEPGKRELHFRFIGQADWTVELLDQAETRLPFFGEPPGVHRRFGFSRRFRLSARAC
jgi:hypothetical protein